MIKYLGDKTKNIGIKKIMKKNQVVILALALMLMTAGYLNYTNNHENENMLLAGLGDAQLVSANVADGNAPTTNEVVESNSEATDSNEQTQIESNENELNNVQGIDEQNALNGTSEESANNVDANAPTTNQQNANQVDTTQETSTQTSNDDYFTRSKLERETMYSQMLETYTGILENEKISSEQKDIAENEIKNINDTKNAIMVVENLFETKGFENAIVFVNNPSVNVVIKAKELTTEQVAQVQNIVQRELKTEIENIHITTN
mgnify:CR=1 FL=1